MNLPKNLKQLRKARGLSQQGVAMRVEGLTRSSLSGYERGTQHPTLCMCVKLSIFYRVTLEELIK